MVTRALVLGGSGFVGRALCREGVRRGWIMSSLSRRGAPEGVENDGLLRQVQWHSGSALEKSIYPQILPDQDYVIHSIGTLFESNPMYNSYKNKPINYESSYKALIRDTAEILVSEASNFKAIKAIGYISAARYGAIGPTLMPRYMQMKEEAEEILKNHAELCSIILRPGFMYGGDRWVTIPMAFSFKFISLFTAGLLPKPLCVDAVARSMINELSKNTNESKILEIPDIAYSASF